MYIYSRSNYRNREPEKIVNYYSIERCNKHECIGSKYKIHVLKKYALSRLSKNAFYFKYLYIDTTTIKNIGGKDCFEGI